MAEFWKTKTLEELNEAEWEALCDGCGKCCLIKIGRSDGTVFQTNMACQMFDETTYRCKDYKNRLETVAICVNLTPEMVRASNWLPDTCAYVLRGQGKELPTWHPLVAGHNRDVPHPEKSINVLNFMKR